VAVEFSEQMQKAINKLRRRINDTDQSSPVYQDEELYDLIADAVDELELHMYQKGRTVADGDFVRQGSGLPVTVTPAEMSLYVLQAALIFAMGTKAKADRDNFSLRKPNLSVDTSGQSADHAETIRILQDEIRRTLMNLVVINGAVHYYVGDDSGGL